MYSCWSVLAGSVCLVRSSSAHTVPGALLLLFDGSGAVHGKRCQVGQAQGTDGVRTQAQAEFYDGPC